MDLTLSPSEEAFRDEVRGWLEQNHPGQPPSGEDEAFEFARRWQRKLHEGDWAGVAWPKEYGGRGATLIEQAIFFEEMVRADAPRTANILGLVMGGPVVITHGTEEQKKRFLEPILSAEEIWCQGFSEPEAGSDLASLKARAVKKNGEWVVSGQKVWTTFAQYAKWCMLVARTDPDAPKHQGMTYFLMDMEQEGVEVKPLVQITGEAEFNEIFMEEARIPEENVIGGVGNGWTVAITTLMYERQGLGLAGQAALEMTLKKAFEFARSISHNGEPVSKDPVIRDRLAQIFIESEIFRLTNYRTLTQVMKKGVPGPEGSLGKLQWVGVNQALMEVVMDFEGPYSQLWRGSEYAIENGKWQYQFLRSRANSIEGGTNEILKNIIAERVLGLPKLR